MEIEVNELINKYKENPYDLEFALQLIGQNENCRQLLELILVNHNLPEDFLLKLLSQLELSDFGYQNLVKLYLQILENCYYVNVGVRLCEYLKQYGHKIGKIQGEKIFAQLLSIFCFDYINGATFYQYYLDFENQLYQHSNNEKDKKQIEQHIRNIYHRTFKVPLKSTQFWDQYQKFEQNKNELAKQEKQFIATQELCAELDKFELAFRANDETTIEQIQTFYANKKIEIPKLNNFFDIALFELNQTDLSPYLQILKQNSNPHILSKALKKISRSNHATLLHFVNYLRTLEQIKSDLITIEFNRIQHKLVESDEKFKFHLEFIQIHLRQHTQSLDQEEIQHTEDFLRELFTTLSQQEYAEKSLPQVYSQWGKVESLLFNNKIYARTAFEKCVQLQSDQLQIWKDYLLSQVCSPIESVAHRDKLRGILKRAAEVVKEDKVRAVQDWLEFEELFGSVEEIERAEQKLIKALELELEIEQQENEDNENSASVEYHDGVYAKQPQKQEAVKEDPAPKIFIDSEKTLFVKNIPKEYNANDLIQLLEQNSGVLECRIVRDKNQQSKGFAYLDFETLEQAVEASKFLSTKIVQGQQIYAALSKPPKLYTNDELTLYLDNLPYSLDEQKLSECCGQGVKQVRLIRDEKGKLRGYGYVEFSDKEVMQKCFEQLKANPFIEGRKVFVDFSDSLEKIKQKQQNQVILIKNLPFKVKETDIRQLFDGMQLNQIVIAKDKEGKPRGFAFVGFDKQKDFKNSLEMSGLEMKGRKLEIIKSERRITGGEIRGEESGQPKSNNDFKSLFK